MLVWRPKSRNMGWDRSIKRIEAMALDLGHDPEEGNAKTAGAKSPE